MKKINELKIHPWIASNEPELVSDILILAKKLKLDKINFDEYYDLVKVGEKNKSSVGYPAKHIAICDATPRLIGNKEHVSLIFVTINNWFKLSPIISCRKLKNGFKVETENSFYHIKNR